MTIDHTMAGDQSAQVDRNLVDTAPIVYAAGRTLRSASITTATKLLEYNPSSGIWQATGTAIAHAPNMADLRSPDDVLFDVHGHSIRRASTQQTVGGPMSRRLTAPATGPEDSEDDKTVGYEPGKVYSDPRVDPSQLYQDNNSPKATWATTFKKGSIAVWRFFLTPTGFFITVYGLNVVAWGAMLFFLLLNIGSMSKERKEIWIEIDSQILNGLFCLTSWGLAPWRIRDTYWLLMWRFGSGKTSKDSINHLAKRSASWYRIQVSDVEPQSYDELEVRETLTGKFAQPTKTWKMDFVVINMMLNSLFQIGMATFMWRYNRHTRPNFGVGLFIGLGCFSSLLAGIMSWWEGRKVKLIEGPALKTVEEKRRVGSVQTLA